MSEKVTGLVVELNRRTCVLLTPEGEFVEAAKPGGQNLKVGEVATLNRHKPFHLPRSLALVACLMIALMGWTAYSTYLPAAVAYISLDINPSLELAVGRQGQVVGTTCFNPEAEVLLQQVEVEGKPVTEAIENLIDTAVQLQFIDQSKPNQILVTVEIEPKGSPEVVDQAIVEETIAKSITKNNIEAELAVAPVEPALHKEAQKQKVSAGRYMLYRQSQSQGKPVEVKETKEIIQKHLDELGYKDWAKERVRYLNKKDENSQDEKSGSKDNDRGRDDDKDGIDDGDGKDEDRDRKNDREKENQLDKEDRSAREEDKDDRAKNNDSQNRDRSDNRPDENQYDKMRDQQGARENRENKDDRDEKDKDSRSQGFNSSDRNPWNLLNNRYNLRQKFENISRPVIDKWKRIMDD